MFEYGERKAHRMVKYENSELTDMLLEIQLGIGEDLSGWCYNLEANDKEDLCIWTYKSCWYPIQCSCKCIHMSTFGFYESFPANIQSTMGSTSPQSIMRTLPNSRIANSIWSASKSHASIQLSTRLTSNYALTPQLPSWIGQVLRIYWPVPSSQRCPFLPQHYSQIDVPSVEARNPLESSSGLPPDGLIWNSTWR